jgi:hypothetical protein
VAAIGRDLYDRRILNSMLKNSLGGTESRRISFDTLAWVGYLYAGLSLRIRGLMGSFIARTEKYSMLGPQNQERIDEQWLNESIELHAFRKRYRRVYATWFLILIIFQVVAITALVFCMGVGWLSLEKWVFGIFTGGVFAEVCVISRIIVMYMFPGDKVMFDVVNKSVSQSKD